MNQKSYLLTVYIWLAVTVCPLYGTLVTFTGNAYTSSGVPATSNVRSAWAGTDPALTWDNVVLTPGTAQGATECTGSCAPSYSDPTQSLTNVSGIAISGITFVGGNSVLYVRPVPLPAPSTGPRNPGYKGLNAQGAYPQWLGGIATSEGIAAPTITITLPTGTRSVGFDFGSITNLTPSSTNGITITTTAKNSSPLVANVSRYDVSSATAPTYATTGPGFYGVTSTEDILTITIIANASTSNWILNLANFRYGVAQVQATPEPSAQLALGSMLILISLLLRRRSKSSQGGNA